MSNTLKPCPWCGSPACDDDADDRAAGCGVSCSNPECTLVGPIDDSDGAKWDALPRRGDSPAIPKQDVAGFVADLAVHGVDQAPGAAWKCAGCGQTNAAWARECGRCETARVLGPAVTLLERAIALAAAARTAADAVSARIHAGKYATGSQQMACFVSVTALQDATRAFDAALAAAGEAVP